MEERYMLLSRVNYSSQALENKNQTHLIKREPSHIEGRNKCALKDGSLKRVR